VRRHLSKEALAGLGQFKLPRGPVDQLDSKFPFKQRQIAAQFGLALSQGFSGPGDVPELHDLDEVPDPIEIHLARHIDGVPLNSIAESLLSTPTTAHILGGSILADSPDRGVINPDHEAFGHPGLYVCDGSVIPTNLAVNPSLTIAALAERFAARFPVKVDFAPDRRL
jgi:choline dehydrogenase-like flavoprotein